MWEGDTLLTVRHFIASCEVNQPSVFMQYIYVPCYIFQIVCSTLNIALLLALILLHKKATIYEFPIPIPLFYYLGSYRIVPNFHSIILLLCS